jgi:hypothetical protein
MAMPWSSEVLNLTEASKNFLEAVAIFPEWVVAAGLIGSLATEGKIAATAAMLTMVVETAELRQNSIVDSRIAAARSSDETGLAWRMQCSLVLSLAEFLPCSLCFWAPFGVVASPMVLAIEVRVFWVVVRES